MATFTNLYHATEAIKHVLETQILPAPASVVVGPPPDPPPITEELRVSLLWITEQGTHRNDGYVRNPDGTSSPPPASLSLFVMITGHGEDPSHNAVAAHRLVGEVLRVFHANPHIELPIPALPTNSGQGKLSLTLVPLTPDLVEKLFSPLQIKHRPFVLYEVAPVQLVSMLATSPVSPVVAPGGVTLTGPTTATPPIVTRLVPRTLAAGGYLRIDGAFSSAIDAIWLGTTKLTTFDVIEPGRSVGVTLPTAGPDEIVPGDHRLVLTSGKLGSEPTLVRVVPSGSWSVNGPNPLSVAVGGLLTLTGQALASATQVYLWPEAGIFAPSDVHKIPTAALTISPTSVAFTVPALSPGDYRVTVEITLGPSVPLQFTPFVNVEITP
ncbi:MAG: Pvc16 family protein [Polyangiaceae bacterium]